MTPDSLSKVYGTSDPPLTGWLSGFVAGDNVSATYRRAPGQSAGSYTIVASLGPSSALRDYDITYNTSVFTITKAAPKVRAVGNACNEADPPCAGRGSAVGAMGETLPVTLLYQGVGKTVYGPSSQPPDEAGTYQVIATTLGDANHVAGAATADLVVSSPPETGEILYTGAALWPTDEGANTALVTSIATVMIARGDLRAARVTFASEGHPHGIPGCIDLSVSPSTPTTGAASCDWKATVPRSQPGALFVVTAILGGSFGPRTHTEVITVSRPGTANLSVAGGQMKLGQSTGAWASPDADATISHGLYAVVPSGGREPKGGGAIVVRQGDATYDLRIGRVISVKSKGTTLTIVARASAQLRHTLAAHGVAAGADLRVSLILKDTSSAQGRKELSEIVVTDSSGKILFSSRCTPMP